VAKNSSDDTRSKLAAEVTYKKVHRAGPHSAEADKAVTVGKLYVSVFFKVSVMDGPHPTGEKKRDKISKTSSPKFEVLVTRRDFLSLYGS
jgi:hypothetical protein